MKVIDKTPYQNQFSKSYSLFFDYYVELINRPETENLIFDAEFPNIFLAFRSIELENVSPDAIKALEKFTKYLNIRGRYGIAIDLLESAKEISMKNPDMGLLTILLQLVPHYRKVGNTPKAEEYAQSGLTEAIRLNSDEYTALFLTNLGFLLTIKGRLDEADHLLKRAMGIAKILNNVEILHEVSIKNGYLADELGHYQEALAFYQEALQISEKKGSEEETCVAFVTDHPIMYQ